MGTIRRTLTVALAVAVMSLGLGHAPAMAGSAGTFVSKINSERAARGLAPLEVYWDLADDATAHAKRMMDKDDLYHNPNLGSVTTGWSKLAENIGVGPDAGRLHDAFMDSSGHRKNILGDYNYVGVGVAVEPSGKLWVSVVFMKGPPGLVGDPEPPPSDDPPPADVPEPPVDDPQPPADDPEPPSADPKPPVTTPKQGSAPVAKYTTAAVMGTARWARSIEPYVIEETVEQRQLGLAATSRDQAFARWRNPARRLFNTLLVVH